LREIAQIIVINIVYLLFTLSAIAKTIACNCFSSSI